MFAGLHQPANLLQAVIFLLPIVSRAEELLLYAYCVELCIRLVACSNIAFVQASSAVAAFVRDVGRMHQLCINVEQEHRFSV